MPWPVGQKPPVYNFPIPVFNVVLRAATKGRFCPAGTRELLERDGGRKEGRSKRSSPGGISIHSCSLRDRSFMLFIISLSFTFFNIWFPCFQPPPPHLFRTICPFYWFCFSGRRIQPSVLTGSGVKSCNLYQPDFAGFAHFKPSLLPCSSYAVSSIQPRRLAAVGAAQGAAGWGGNAEHPQVGMPKAEGFCPLNAHCS